MYSHIQGCMAWHVHVCRPTLLLVVNESEILHPIVTGSLRVWNITPTLDRNSFPKLLLLVVYGCGILHPLFVRISFPKLYPIGVT